MNITGEYFSLVSWGSSDRLAWTERGIALGTFDGVHRGHQAVLTELVRLCAEHCLLPTALTFSPLPATVANSTGLLTTIEERLEHFRAAGIQQAVILDFAAVSRFSALDYLEEVLRQQLKARLLCCGADHSFGRHKEGNLILLREWASRHSIQLQPVEPHLVTAETQKISSSLIRKKLQAGLIKEANDLLGYPYAIHGKVVSGQGHGQQLGFPTLNCSYPPEKVSIPRGVYAARTNGQLSAVNFGVAPTLNRGSTRGLYLESHLIDWASSGDHRPLPSVDHPIQIEFLRFLRPERKFADTGALQEQIAQDCQQIRDEFAPLKYHQ